MKKISLLLATVFVSSFFGQMKFAEGKFSDILAQAKKENKIVFVDAYASWCGPCKLMAKNIFPLPDVGDYYNANFVNVKIDMEKGEGIALAKKYGVKAYPTYLFLDSDGELLFTGTGYYQATDFIEIGKKAKDPSMQVVALKKKFESGNNDPDFLKNMISVFAFSDPVLAEKAMKRYFDGKKGQSLQKEDWNMMLSQIKSSESLLYPEFVSRKEELLKMIPEEQYARLLRRFQVETIRLKAYNSEKKELNEKLMFEEAKKIMSEQEAQNLVVATKMRMALSKNDYKAYAVLAQQYYGDGTRQELSSSNLNEVAWNFFEYVEDKNALLQAVKWAEQSVKLDENYANTDTLANLYFKVGDKKNAKKWGERSVELGKKEGEDVSTTEKLLEKL